MLRRCLPQLSRGKYTSMMDLGGVASAKTNTKFDFSKNNKVRAVALDFDLLTRSIEELHPQKNSGNDSNMNIVSEDGKDQTKERSMDISASNIVQNIASLLNVDINLTNSNMKSKEKGNKDDLSSTKNNESEIISKSLSFSNDIRDKYARKIRQQLSTSDTGLANSVSSIDFVKEVSNQSTGDADMHFHARKIAIHHQESNSSSLTNQSRGSRWLSTTGTGQLLSFLESRSMKIILLPTPNHNIISNKPNINDPPDSNYNNNMGEQMEDLSNQLPSISFNQLIHEGENAKTILQQLINDLQRPPSKFNGANNEQSKTETTNKQITDDEKDDGYNYFNNKSYTADILPKHCLVVSDRDDYLKIAKDGGMFTCRIRPKQGRRGNITAAYDVSAIVDVMDIINEIDGISFNSVLGSR